MVIYDGFKCKHEAVYTVHTEASHSVNSVFGWTFVVKVAVRAQRQQAGTVRGAASTDRLNLIHLIALLSNGF